MLRRIQLIGLSALILMIASTSTVLPAHAVDQNFGITLDQVVSPDVPSSGAGNIEATGDRDIYTFTTVTTNQKVFIDRQPGTGLSCFTPDLRFMLTDPDGDPIFPDFISNTCGADPGLQTLPDAGTYTLTVAGYGGNTGGYRFGVFLATDQFFDIDIDEVVSPGAPESGAGTIESPGDRDVYTFWAAANTKVFVDRQSGGNCFNPDVVISLITPNASPVFPDYASSSCGSDPAVHTLTQTGYYTMTVKGYADNYGGYGIAVHEATDDLTPIHLNDVVSPGAPESGAGVIETPGDRDVYTFSAPAGQQVLIDRLPGTGLNCFNPDLSVTLKAPNGTSVFSNHVMSSCSSDPAVQTLTQAGTYTLTVSGYADNYGPYKFFLEAVGYGGPQTAQVDLFDVETLILCEDNLKTGFTGQSFYDYPWDPDAPGLPYGAACGDPAEQWFRAWIEYEVSDPTWVYAGVWDWSLGQYIAEQTVYRDAGDYRWQPSWNPAVQNSATCTPFTPCADSLSVLVWHWDGDEWIYEDAADWFLQADWDISGDDDEDHFYWSPNKYNRPVKLGSAEGEDWVVLSQRFLWFDNTRYSVMSGSDRLNRLQTWAGGTDPQFQVEYRRDREGWDAAATAWIDGIVCVKVPYDWWSNIPDFDVTDTTVEEAACLENEEAEGATESVDDLIAIPGSDPTGIVESTGYYYNQTLHRLGDEQGDWFQLSTEFELKEGIEDEIPNVTGFDWVVATQVWVQF